MIKKLHATYNDPIFAAIEERNQARSKLMAISKCLDKSIKDVDTATDELVEKDRNLLAIQPTTNDGAVALLHYLAEIIAPYEEISLLTLPALASVRSVLTK